MSDIAAKLRTPFVKHLVFVLVWGVAALLIAFNCEYAVTAPNAPEPLETGFRHLYNMQFQAAHQTFYMWKQVHPEDPLGPVFNAAAYLFDEFERLHILDFDVFASDEKMHEIENCRPDPKIKEAIDGELTKADDLAAKILVQSSGDTDALFAKMLADGLRGDYAALVEKRKRTAVDFLKSSRTFAEKLIAIDPDYHDAYLAIGIENYVLGGRSGPTRWMLRMSGAQTDRAKGIANLKITAERGRYLAPYARILMAIAAFRDQDFTTARTLLTDLAREFPQNRLYKIELARLQG